LLQRFPFFFNPFKFLRSRRKSAWKRPIRPNRREGTSPLELKEQMEHATFDLHPGLGAPTVDEESLIHYMVGRLNSLRGVGAGSSGRRLVEVLSRSLRQGKVDLPRLPTVAQDLIGLNADSLLDYRQVAELISRDQDLVARVLQVANSPVYTSVPVTSLEQAIAILGLDVFCSVVVGVVATSAIYKVPGFEQDVRRERNHAMEVANVASRLCRSHGQEEWRSMVFLGGLLHDAGKVLVLRNLGLLKRQHPDVHIGPYLLNRLMDELHVPLGLYYGLHRGLAKEVRDVIVYHHHPNESPESTRSAVTIVAVADALSESKLPLGSDLLLRSAAAQLGLDVEEPRALALLNAGVDILRELRHQD
jgi:putative nucleotidyltransferase with HDIG domain